MMTSDKTDSTQISTFLLNGQCYGIDVQHVLEVGHSPSYVAAPLAPKAVKGLMNLRGLVLTCVDLRTCLQIEGATKKKTMYLVAQFESSRVVFLVDEIKDVVEISQDIFEGMPETIKKNIRKLLHGVYKLDNDFLLEIDVGKLLEYVYTQESDVER